MLSSALSTLHRSLIAFSALQLGHSPRATILASYQVTEADLNCYYAEWQRLQQLRTVEQSSATPSRR